MLISGLEVVAMGLFSADNGSGTTADVRGKRKGGGAGQKMGWKIEEKVLGRLKDNVIERLTENVIGRQSKSDRKP